MRIFTSADNRRAYRVKAIVDNSVLYDVAFNPDYIDPKSGDTGDTMFNRTMPLDKFAVHLANLGVYFKPGHDAIVAAGFKVQ